ncbi:MAG: tetratricopeptide repeat protein [Gammaproteobacteria bacterium]
MIARDLLNRGQFLLSVRAFDHAIKVCDSLLADDSQCSSALTVRAFAYKELGDYDAAITDLNEYIRQRPKSPRGYSLRGLVYALKGKYVSEQAFADFLMSQTLSNQHAATFFHVEELFLHFDKANIFAAIQVLPRKIKIQLLKDCLDESAYFGIQFRKQRGFNECSIEAGMLKKIRRYQQRIKSWTATEWERFGDRKQHEEKYDAAIKAYCEALQIVDNEKLKVLLYVERGNMFCRLKDEQTALADYNLALELDPRCVGAHVNRAGILSVAESLESLAAGIKAYEAMQELIAADDMILTDREMDILNHGIATMFDVHGKRKIVEAIKLLDEDKHIALLQKCLLEDHYLGAHFWKNSVPGTNCGLDKGTLGEIRSYLRRLEGVDEVEVKPSFVASVVKFFRPVVVVGGDDIEMQNTRDMSV